MTAGTMVAIRPQRASHGSLPPGSAMAAELSKMLALVAPGSMQGEARLEWVATAMDALEGISADEVRAVAAQVKRSITRPAQIVPEIARLVAEARARRSVGSASGDERAEARWRIETEWRRRRLAASSPAEVERADEWEREAKRAAGLPYRPAPPPLTQAELDRLPAHVADMGLKAGWLDRRDGRLVERSA